MLLTLLNLHHVYILPVAVSIIYGRIQGEILVLPQQNQDVGPRFFEDSFQVLAPKLHRHYSHSLV